MAESGEQEIATPALESDGKHVKKSKKKLTARSISATWLGIDVRTGEHIVATRNGEAILVRTIHRVPGEDQWVPETVLAVKALPRRPNPSRGGADPEPKLNTDTVGEASPDGADLGRPECDNPGGGPRELRMTERLLEKLGYTEGCPRWPTNIWTDTVAAFTAMPVDSESMKQ